MLFINGLNVANSYVLRNFMSAIEVRNHSGFIYYACIYAGVFAASTIVAVFFRFAEERLGLLWRDWMTRLLTGWYIDGKIYLHFQSELFLTNPDQRISEDVKSLTVTTLSFVLMVFNSTITVISFSGVLWMISPTLFLVAVVYAFIGSGLTVLLGRTLIRLNYYQQDFEADFRADLLRVRQTADGIALAGYEGRVRSRLMSRIDHLIRNYRRIIAINRNLGFFTTGYNYMIQLIPALIVAPLFISHQADFGVIGQSAMAFSTLVAALSLIVTQFQSISSYASVLTRLGEFAEAASRTAEHLDVPCIDCNDISDHFIFSDLTLRSATNGQRILIDKLNLSIEKGKRVLVYGPNKAAKLAFFRATGGLAVPGSGHIDRPTTENRAFLPENPYLPSGPLRDILIAAARDDSISHQEIQIVLRKVGLPDLLSSIDDIQTSRNWHAQFSLKEEQLVAIARVLLASPDFAILDHLSSALGSTTEKQILDLMTESGITYISICEEEPDPDYFDAALELNLDGTWKWTELFSD